MVRWFNRTNEVANQTNAGASNNSEQRSEGFFHDRSRWYWRFAQQNLDGWSPILTGTGVVLYFLAVGIFCIALGIPILTASLGTKEYSVRYDNQGQFQGLSSDDSQQVLYAAGGEGSNYTVQLTVQESMVPPIYVFYELHSFYQNHKRYVRSRSDNQLGGKGGSKGGASSACSPQEYLGNAPNASLPNDGQIDPCGLIAWSNFNDTYSASIVTASGSQALPISEENLAWSYDQNHLYGNEVPVNFNTVPALRGGAAGEGIPVNQNQHLMVWLRPAAQPTFRKLWGRINQTLPAGTVITWNVTNRYDTYAWKGKKEIVVTTNSWVGGKNLFLGIIYLVVGGLALIASLAFLAAYHGGLAGRRKFGDLSYLSWNRK